MKGRVVPRPSPPSFFSRSLFFPSPPELYSLAPEPKAWNWPLLLVLLSLHRWQTQYLCSLFLFMLMSKRKSPWSAVVIKPHCAFLQWTILQLSALWPSLWMAARQEVILFWYRPLYFCCVNQVVLVLTSWHSNEKAGREVCIKARSPPASQSFKGQATEHTTAKWPIATKTGFHTEGNRYVF